MYSTGNIKICSLQMTTEKRRSIPNPLLLSSLMIFALRVGCHNRPSDIDR